MRPINTIITLLLSVLCISTAQANNFAQEDASTLQIWATNYGSNYMRFHPVGGNAHNPYNCLDPDSYFIDASLTDEEKKRIYNLVVAAKVMNRSITFHVNGCMLGTGNNAKPMINEAILN